MTRETLSGALLLTAIVAQVFVMGLMGQLSCLEFAACGAVPVALAALAVWLVGPR